MVLFRKYTGNDEKYYDISSCEKGQLLVEGKYLGTRIGRKFGNTEFEFRDSTTGKVVVLTGRHLEFLVNRHLKPGQVCRVIFTGDVLLTSGKFKGKNTHTYEIEVAEDDNAPAASTKTASDDKAPWDVSDDDLRV
jgi:hypothetical protein